MDMKKYIKSWCKLYGDLVIGLPVFMWQSPELLFKSKCCPSSQISMSCKSVPCIIPWLCAELLFYTIEFWAVPFPEFPILQFRICFMFYAVSCSASLFFKAAMSHVGCAVAEITRSFHHTFLHLHLLCSMWEKNRRLSYTTYVVTDNVTWDK